MSAYRIDDTTPIEERLRLLEGEVTAAMQTPAFRQLARRLDASVPKNARDRPHLLAEAALRQAQSYTYRPDPPGEWFQTGIETLAVGGDCEDLSVVFVALARLLGLRAELVWITQPHQALNHVTADVLPSGRPLWADASIRGAMVGESPYDAIHRVKAYHVQGVA